MLTPRRSKVVVTLLMSLALFTVSACKRPLIPEEETEVSSKGSDTPNDQSGLENAGPSEPEAPEDSEPTVSSDPLALSNPSTPSIPEPTDLDPPSSLPVDQTDPSVPSSDVEGSGSPDSAQTDVEQTAPSDEEITEQGPSQPSLPDLPEPSDDSEAQARTLDDDGDSFAADVDCDDLNPWVHPGVFDLIGDSIDMNCSPESIQTFAGNPWGDEELLSKAVLEEVRAIARDSQGNFYIAEGARDNFHGHRLRKVTPEGIISTVAGIGRVGYTGDGGPSERAALSNPTDVVIDSLDNIYILDTGNSVIRKIDTNGIISTFAGTGEWEGHNVISAPRDARTVNLFLPESMTIDRDDSLYVSDTENNRVLKITSDGMAMSVAGDGIAGYSFRESAPEQPATEVHLDWPTGVAVDAAGNLYILNRGPASEIVAIYKVDQATGMMSVITADNRYGYDGDGGPVADAAMTGPERIAVDAAGNLYFSDYYNDRIRKIDTNGTISTVAVFSTPYDIMIDTDGTLYATGNGIRHIDADGFVSNFTLGDYAENSDNDNSAMNARLGRVYAVATGMDGDVFVASELGGISKIDAQGMISTLPLPMAQTYSIATDRDGNLYAVDSSFNGVIKIAVDGTLSIVAGTGEAGFAGDGGLATEALLNEPYSVAVDDSGTLYISDFGNSRIRKVSPDGIISTVAGSGNWGFSGDGGPALDADIKGSVSMAVGQEGALYFIDLYNYRVRKIDADGIISTVAGTGTLGRGQDGLSATEVELNMPTDVKLDARGNLYIVDSGNDRILRMDNRGIVTAVVGDGTPGFAGDGGLPQAAQLNRPYGIALDTSGKLYIAEYGNEKVRVVTP